MLIAHISDTHLTLEPPDSVQRLKDFVATVDDINTLDPAPDVIIHSGDIVHNGRADEYAQAAAILGRARAPVCIMAGNKDERGNLRAAFSECAYLENGSGFIDYAVEDFPVRLVMLDTLNPQSNKGAFCADRLRRLAELLEADRVKPIAVFTHHPPCEVRVGPDPVHFDSLDEMSALAGALQNCGRVAGVFCGHVHRSTCGHAGPVPVSIAPCIATALRKGDYPEDMKTRPVYCLHSLQRDGGFSTQSRIVGARP